MSMLGRLITVLVHTGKALRVAHTNHRYSEVEAKPRRMSKTFCAEPTTLNSPENNIVLWVSWWAVGLSYPRK
ncbi:hypothetical protein CPB83DRAFT_105907 [Crepidotus variabilis]|uniref:Uncharacterized protein n=1 Tax=Crepidotus variabilis TaxID=179855 RepID=A0A9P6EME2_9AGAR|nr:hypothetical protein CPB83DRAFT_105907 [Crepidotus variabilis]